MALKALTLFLATLVLVITKVSSTTDHEELKMVKVPTQTTVPVQIPVMKSKTKLPVIKSKADCIPVCNNRCAEVHNEKKMCLRACNTCCNRCKCAPPTPSSSRAVCGKCYAKMTTHGGRLKCP